MRYFLDTEFNENGQSIELFSLGIIAEDGRELYIETFRAMIAKGEPGLYDPWLQQNVIPYLDGKEGLGRYEMRKALLDFCGESPEFWGYFADYDWVALCQIFGRMIDLPHGWPMYCRDLKQLADEKGVRLSEVVPQEDEHHALADARWNLAAYKYLTEERS